MLLFVIKHNRNFTSQPQHFSATTLPFNKITCSRTQHNNNTLQQPILHIIHSTLQPHRVSSWQRPQDDGFARIHRSNKTAPPQYRTITRPQFNTTTPPHGRSPTIQHSRNAATQQYNTATRQHRKHTHNHNTSPQHDNTSTIHRCIYTWRQQDSTATIQPVNKFVQHPYSTATRHNRNTTVLYQDITTPRQPFNKNTVQQHNISTRWHANTTSLQQCHYATFTHFHHGNTSPIRYFNNTTVRQD